MVTVLPSKHAWSDGCRRYNDGPIVTLDAMWSHECVGAVAAAERATGVAIDSALCTPDLHRQIPGPVATEAIYLFVFALALLALARAVAAPCRRRRGPAGALGCLGACALVWAAAVYLVANWDHAAVARQAISKVATVSMVHEP